MGCVSGVPTSLERSEATVCEPCSRWTAGVERKGTRHTYRSTAHAPHNRKVERGREVQGRRVRGEYAGAGSAVRVLASWHAVTRMKTKAVCA